MCSSLFFFMPNFLSYSYVYKRKEERHMEEWISIIGNVGFPIVVTLYLLHRIENKLDGVIVAIEKLPQQMKRYETPHETK